MAEEPQSRPDADNSKRKLEEIQAAKQRAQEVVARLISDAGAKRPRTDDGSVPPSDPDAHRPPLDFSQKPPFFQPASNATYGSAPSVAQPAPYYNFQGTSKKMDIPNGKVGVVIGKGGETIKYLQLQSGARIQITRDADADPYSQTRDVELIGTAEQVSRAEQLIKEVISESDAGGSGPSAVIGSTSMQPGSEQFAMKVPNNKVAKIIGKGGETIKTMQSRSGARIQVIPLHLPPGDTSTERNVFINGTKEQIEMAKELLNEVINETRPRSALAPVNYMQQGYAAPGNWGAPGQPPVQQQAAYGYMQPGANPSPYYGGYPQPTGWDQSVPPSTAPPPQQGTGYNYYGAPGQAGTAPPNANYDYAQPLPATAYGYDQSYSQQQQTHGHDPPAQTEQDSQYPYATQGYGLPSVTSVTPDGTTPSQSYGTQASTGLPTQPMATPTSQPYGTQSAPVAPVQPFGASSSQPYPAQSSATMPPTQPSPYGQQPAAPPTGYMPSQNYPGTLPPQQANAQMGYGQVGYGGQQPLHVPPTSQAGYAQSGYPAQPLPPQSNYVQGANPPSYGLPQPQPTAHAYTQPPPAYGSERSRDGNVTVGSYGSTPAAQDAAHAQS